MDVTTLKNKVCAEIDRNKDTILSWGNTLLHHPELGYKELKTSAFIRSKLDELNIPYIYPAAVTGIKGRISGNSADLNICIIGEMDGVICTDHPNADGLTGAAHACGHNAQVAAMLGAACGLLKSGVMPELWGSVTFLAAPAEEYMDIAYRRQLKENGTIKYFGGKQQLLYEGMFDDVDLAIMIHSHAETPETKLFLQGGSLGFVYKTMEFKGRESHGSEPYKGVNALNAAMLALMGIHANRETFRDEDKIRIHPIITNGGEIVNTIPANVTMETYVRAGNLEAMKDAALKVDRAVNGAAMSVGAKIKIKTTAGYLPLMQDNNLSAVFEGNAAAFVPQRDIYHGVDMTGSTDMGDLSHLIPCIQPTMGGFSGTAHSRDFGIANPDAAYILSAKILAMTVIDLLYDKAKSGTEIKNTFKPVMTKEEYIRYLDQQER